MGTNVAPGRHGHSPQPCRVGGELPVASPSGAGGAASELTCGVSLGRRQGTADRQPRCSPGAGPAAGRRPHTGGPGGRVVGRDGVTPGPPGFSRPFTPILPRTRWLSSERPRPDEWGIAMLTFFFFLLQCNLQFPSTLGAGDVAKSSSNLKCLFCSFQCSEFKSHALLKL